ncbi:MAG: glycerate kinase [bacterium]
MDPSVYRQHLREIFLAGVEAVEPAGAVRRAVTRKGDILAVGQASFDLGEYERILVVGAGKAAAPMARALEEVLAERLTAGRIVVKYGHVCPLHKVEILEAGHPVPDASGIEATRRILEVVDEAGERDLVFCLLSGGGSALLVCPANGIGLAEKQTVTRVLLASGADIAEMNALRKHLSRVKGGQLARRAWPATVITLVLSDVVGDPLDAIASGPTVPDGSSFEGCWGIVEKHGISDRMPGKVLELLRQGREGLLPETPKQGEEVFRRVTNRIVGSNLLAIRAAARKAYELGYRPLVLSTRIVGETRAAAGLHGAIFREVRATGCPLRPPACILSGGETTVTLKGTGKGGRNQEFSLAVALDIRGEEGIFFLSAGTDGTDGPTDAAGAFCDGGTVERGRLLGVDAAARLEENDSYRFFEATGELLKTGPTNTNVMDIRICLFP